MKVYLRKKSLNNERKSLYLDIYSNTGERTYEFLKLYLVKARTEAQKSQNKETHELAKHIANKREQDLNSDQYDYTPAFKKETDFIIYFQKFLETYRNKDVRIVKYCLKHFKEFISSQDKKTIKIKQIDETLCNDFKHHLELKLFGETPYNYFTKFKKVLRQAVKDRIITSNPADEIKNIKQDGLKKEILSINEIQLLAKTECKNNEIKKAFLFCLNTGLRFCDVTSLTWKNIDNNILKFEQAKTKHSSSKAQLIISLNSSAKKLIGERGKPDELLFNLPSFTSCLNTLKTWTKTAGLEKNITWHSARHSFGVNLLRSDVAGADVKTVSSLLGHSSLRHTEKYTRVIDELKTNAINKLPEIEL